MPWLSHFGKNARQLSLGLEMNVVPGLRFQQVYAGVSIGERLLDDVKRHAVCNPGIFPCSPKEFNALSNLGFLQHLSNIVGRSITTTAGSVSGVSCKGCHGELLFMT